MKIACPLSKKDDVAALISAGADEFYVGIVTKRWEKKYTLIGSSNRRYFRDSSFMDVAELKTAAQCAEKQGKRIYLALNAPYYTSEQYPLLLKDVKQALGLGIRSFIVADMGLLLRLQQFKGLHIAMSAVATTFNSQTALFYKKLGAERIILPRHLTIQEIKAIVSKLNGLIELEVFMLYDFCRNVDGFCTFHHGLEELLGMTHGCLYVNAFQLASNHTNKVLPSVQRIINNRLKSIAFNTFAGATYLPEFKKLDITSAKIVGRQLPFGLKRTAVAFIKQSLSLNDKNQIEELFEKTFMTDLTGTCNCYS